MGVFGAGRGFLGLGKNIARAAGAAIMLASLALGIFLFLTQPLIALFVPAATFFSGALIFMTGN